MGEAADAVELEASDLNFDDEAGKPVVALGFAPDGTYPLAASGDGLIRKRNVADRSLANLKTTPGGVPVESNIAFTKDGRYSSVACGNGPLVFDAAAFRWT